MQKTAIRSPDLPPDQADWLILASNLLTLAVALLFQWDVRQLHWPYWLQSIVIGFFHFGYFVFQWRPTWPGGRISAS